MADDFKKKDDSTKTVAAAPPAPKPSVEPAKIKVIVDGESYIYEATSNVDAWALHNDKLKTMHTMKQKNPTFEKVK